MRVEAGVDTLLLDETESGATNEPATRERQRKAMSVGESAQSDALRSSALHRTPEIAITHVSTHHG